MTDNSILICSEKVSKTLAKSAIVKKVHNSTKNESILFSSDLRHAIMPLQPDKTPQQGSRVWGY